MCERCEAELEAAGINPVSLVDKMGMAMAGELDRREQENDQRIRLACLDLAVKVKGHDNDSRKVLSSAHAYYDFVIGRDAAVKIKDEDVNV